MTDDDPMALRDSLDIVVRGLRPGGASGANGTPAGAAAIGAVFERWDEAVGEVVAAHARPVRLDGDRLVVEVDDPAWATQFQFFAATVRQRLGEVAGAVIGEIDVRVRGVGRR